MTHRYQHHILLLFTTIIYQNKSLILHCNDEYSCAGNSYRCSDEMCEINCNTDYACEDTYFRCDDSYLHGECQVNCAGGDGCETMVVTSFRDTNIVCSGPDSCDKMEIAIHGVNPHDKINATLTSLGGYSDSFRLLCSGDGIQECFLDCRDNLDFYSCIQVQFDCYTRGICRFRCENSNACCGCTISDIFSSTTYENTLHCYEGSDNCIQVDPGGCSASYGCIAKIDEPTSPPTEAPTSQPTSPPTSNPTVSPTASTLIPTVAPTTAPTTLPTPSPTDHGATGHPSSAPSPSPTPSPTTIATLFPTVSPSNDPTHLPSNNPTTPLTLSPTVRPTPAPYITQNPAKATCISLVESIENLIGVTTDDFKLDDKLQRYVMNTTKLVIYEAFKTSHIYDMEELCQNFWRCFFLKLISIRGNTLLEIDICAWSQLVQHAMFKKVEMNAEEMGAFMKKGLKFYLVDGPAYTGYDDVVIDDTTRVMFNLVTASPIANAQTTDIIKNSAVMGSHGSPKGSRTAVGIVVAVIFVCICLLLIGWFYCGKHNKIKRELFETKQRVVDLEALTGVEGDGVELDNVVPDEEGEGAPNTVPMSTNAPPMSTSVEEEEDDDAVARLGPGSVPGSVVSGGAVIADRISIPELPALEDEGHDEDDDGKESSSSEDDEMDALYVKKESLGDALYGAGTPGTKTSGGQGHITVSGDHDENDST